MLARLLLVVTLVFAPLAAAAGSSSTHPTKSGTSHKSASKTTHSTGSHSHSSKSKCTSCARDSHGRIERSEKAKHDFERQSGYPHGRPGYVVDHSRPLESGGLDVPSNLQWQTVAEAKAKDKTESRCR